VVNADAGGGQDSPTAGEDRVDTPDKTKGNRGSGGEANVRGAVDPVGFGQGEGEPPGVQVHRAEGRGGEGRGADSARGAGGQCETAVHGPDEWSAEPAVVDKPQRVGGEIASVPPTSRSPSHHHFGFYYTRRKGLLHSLLRFCFFTLFSSFCNIRIDSVGEKSEE